MLNGTSITRATVGLRRFTLASTMSLATSVNGFTEMAVKAVGHHSKLVPLQ